MSAVQITSSLDQSLLILAQWVERGWLRELDLAFAEFLADLDKQAHPLLVYAGALVSHQLGRGHVCLDMVAALADSKFTLSLPPDGEVDGDLILRPAEVFTGVNLALWQQVLRQSRLIGDGAGDSPLVLSGTRLYLRRYWQYEDSVRSAINQRLQAGRALREALPPEVLREFLDGLFPDTKEAIDWQKLACALAAGNAFSIITGGPGTGKTTTVVKLLALLQSAALLGPGGRPLHICLAAPTGKAAARLNESIDGALSQLDLSKLENVAELRLSIPSDATTLHRLLGSRANTARLKHHAGNPLSLDVLVIDEASMVDLQMMAAVLAALPPHARLILLGDKDQLASVEAGAVLGELCSRALDGHYVDETVMWLEAASGMAVPKELRDTNGDALDQAVAVLRRSHRFSENSGIGQLADAVNAGDVIATKQVWLNAYSDLSNVDLKARDNLRQLVIDGNAAGFPNGGMARRDNGRDVAPPVGYGHYLNTLSATRPSFGADPTDYDHWAGRVLQAHRQFQVLCALRHGPWGVEGLNDKIARILQTEGLISAVSGWYVGRPVMITKNDYGLGLMNGDIGIALELPQGEGAERQMGVRVAFSSGDADGGIRWVLPSRIQSVETVYAMTVHKSQGSEFAHTALVLPESAESAVLTRELIYTGVTRARHWLTLGSAGKGQTVAEAGIGRRVLRATGLRE